MIYYEKREKYRNNINYILISCQISISTASFTNQRGYAKISILDLIDILHIREIQYNILRNANKSLNRFKYPD